MPPIMMRCANCGHKFSSGISISSGSDTSSNSGVTMYGNTTNCPNCGHWQSMPKGNFRSVGNLIQQRVSNQWIEWNPDKIINFIYGSSSPLDVAIELQVILQSYKQTNNAAVLEEASRFAPVLKGVGNKNIDRIIAIIALIISILQYFQDFSGKEGENEATLKKQLEESHSIIGEYKNIIEEYKLLQRSKAAYQTTIEGNVEEGNLEPVKVNSSKAKFKKKQSEYKSPKHYERTGLCSCNSGKLYVKCHGMKGK